MSADRDSFRVEGGCWCPAERTLGQLWVSGHTQPCTQARKGLAVDRRHMTEMDERRRADENAGRQLREAAIASGVPADQPAKETEA